MHWTANAPLAAVRHPNADTTRRRRVGMEQPEPAADWPDDPLSPAAARDLLDREAVVAVWTMDHDAGVRSSVVPPGTSDDAVVDVVLETTTGFEMYSYTGGRWMDYGTQRKDDEDAPSMAGTLERYEVLAGESDAF